MLLCTRPATTRSSSFTENYRTDLIYLHILVCVMQETALLRPLVTQSINKKSMDIAVCADRPCRFRLQVSQSHCQCVWLPLHQYISVYSTSHVTVFSLALVNRKSRQEERLIWNMKTLILNPFKTRSQMVIWSCWCVYMSVCVCVGDE